MAKTRSAGVLLAVSSLPSRYGIGCFDQAAYDFVDDLVRMGQTYWQILPLGATSGGDPADSPYQAFSAFAGNPFFISLDRLVEEGVLTREECGETDFGSDPGRVDYETLRRGRMPLLRRAYERSRISENPDYQRFQWENSWWLEDYALFMAVNQFFGEIPWTDWPEDIRKHWGFALDHYRRELYFEIEFHKYLQYQFARQWQALKGYANGRGIRIVGDIPIYVSPQGADVWAHPELFQLDGDGRPYAVAGCPPDGFAPEGQIWGNPLYRWESHKNTWYDWWCSRMWYSFQLYDVVRIDHFRGFDQYYSVPFGAKSALEGHWEQGPGLDFFRALQERLGWHPVIAEDLGFMTDSVRQLVRDTGFPNMKVVQFAFDSRDTGSANDYLPHNYGENCVVYTGTHDNETITGWMDSITPEELALARDYLCDHTTPQGELYWSFIALAMRSTAKDCIIPIQDYLGLGNDSRMNRPSTVEGNWTWRLLPGQLDGARMEQILRMTRIFGRYNWALEKQDN